MKLIAKTFAGLEQLLAGELTALGANDIEIGNRMVSFSGDKEMLYRANFCLRTAVKILKPIREFKASDADEVYEQAKKIEWDKIMDVDDTFVVDAVVFSEEFRHSRFAAYRVKDAIADYFRDRTGKRPNVGISNPDIRVNLHIAEHDVTISLDSSGESLHHRGYKVANVAAPLNEVLAAGMIMLTGWDGQCDFIDPMCGSGTILIEAALIARNIYPGVFRKEFAFEKWKDFDPDLFDSIYNDDSQEREFTHRIYGYDINHSAVAIATENVKSAGVNQIVEIAQRDVRDFEQPAEPAIIVTNPPYGERITTDDILGLYEAIGTTLKHSFVGGDAWILSYHEECFDRIGFRPSTRFILYNGALECEFRKYQVFAGKLKERRIEGMDIKTEEDRRRNLKFKGHKQRNESEDEGEGRRNRQEQSEPVLNRHNFKWGDRKSDYRPDGDDHYFKSRPFKKRETTSSDQPAASKRPFKKDGDFKPKRDFKKDGDEKFKGHKSSRDEKFKGSRDKEYKSFDRKPKSKFSSHEGDKRSGGKRPASRLKFDSDGRPVKE